MSDTAALAAEMEELEDKARDVLSNPGLDHAEKRRRIAALLRRYLRAQKELGALLRAYRARTERRRSTSRDEAASIMRDLLTSPEFQFLNLFVAAVAVWCLNPVQLTRYPALDVPGHPELAQDTPEPGQDPDRDEGAGGAAPPPGPR